MLLRSTHQRTSRAATRKLSSAAGQPTITLRTSLDGTDDGGGISESRSSAQLQSNCQAAQRTEPPRTTPSCSAS